MAKPGEDYSFIKPEMLEGYTDLGPHHIEMYAIERENSSFRVERPFKSNEVTVTVVSRERLELSLSPLEYGEAGLSEKYTEGFCFTYTIHNPLNSSVVLEKLEALNGAYADCTIDLGGKQLDPGETVSGNGYCRCAQESGSTSMSATYVVKANGLFNAQVKSNEAYVQCDYFGFHRELLVTLTGRRTGEDTAIVNVTVVNKSGDDAVVNTLDVYDGYNPLNIHIVYDNCQEEFYIFEELSANTGFTKTIQIDISDEEKQRGYMLVSALALGEVYEQVDMLDRVISSNEPVLCILLRDSELEANLTEISVPANGEAYEVGETVTYQITLANPMGYEIGVDTGLNVNNGNHKASGSFVQTEGERLFIGPDGDSVKRAFTYTVTGEDAAGGDTITAEGRINVYSQLHPDTPDGKTAYGCFETNTVTTKIVRTTGLEPIESEDVIAVITETGAPANDSFFTPAERPSFELVINNYGEEDYILGDDLIIFAAVQGGTFASINPIEIEVAGERIPAGTTYRYSFTVDESNSSVDPVELIVHFEGTCTSADMSTVYSVYSNRCSVELVGEEPIRKLLPEISRATLTAEELKVNVELAVTSSPANNTAYKPGETITYAVTVTNETDYAIIDFNVALTVNNNSASDPITDSAELETLSLEPGETKTFTFTHTVTTYDVNAGHLVTAKALCTVYGTEGDEKTHESKTVESEVLPEGPQVDYLHQLHLLRRRVFRRSKRQSARGYDHHADLSLWREYQMVCQRCSQNLQVVQ